MSATFKHFPPVCATEAGLSSHRSPLRRLCSGKRWISGTWDDQWRPGPSRRCRGESAARPCDPRRSPPYLYSCHLGTGCPICLRCTQSKSVKDITPLIHRPYHRYSITLLTAGKGNIINDPSDHCQQPQSQERGVGGFRSKKNLIEHQCGPQTQFRLFPKVLCVEMMKTF